jgi:hypothetical protein
LFVPDLRSGELERVIALKLGPLLPLPPSETVFGFRLGSNAGSEGRCATVGAVRTELLRQILEACTESGLRVRAVLPIAFGSWLAARSIGLKDCAVVSVEGTALAIDLIRSGELCYSRSIPLSESPTENLQEIEATFEIAETEPGPILSLGSVDLDGEQRDPRTPSEFFTDPHTIDRMLFSLELPETSRQRRSRSLQQSARRATIAAALALAVSGWTWYHKSDQARKSQHEAVVQQVLEQKLAAKRTADDEKASQLSSAALVLDQAFSPAQRMGDVVCALSNRTPKDTWLTGLSLERGKRLLLRGECLDGKLVPTFVDNLSKDSRFSGIKLVFAQTARIGQRKVVRFSISAHVNGNLPIGKFPTELARK